MIQGERSATGPQALRGDELEDVIGKLQGGDPMVRLNLSNRIHRLLQAAARCLMESLRATICSIGSSR